MTGTNVTVDLAAEVQARYAGLAGDLLRCAEFADLGERFGQVPAEFPLPDRGTFVRFGAAGELAVEIRSDFAAYCGRFAMLAMLTSVEAHLGDLLRLRRFVEIFVKEGGLDGQKRTAVYDQVAHECRRANAVSLVALVIGAFLSAETKLFVGHLSTLVRARNCLAHRGGTVRREDLRDTETELVVTWRHPFVFGADGQPGFPGMKVVGGQQIEVRIVEARKAFALGSPVLISPAEGQQIAIFLSDGCRQICNEVHAALAAILV